MADFINFTCSNNVFGSWLLLKHPAMWYRKCINWETLTWKLNHLPQTSSAETTLKTPTRNMDKIYNGKICN